MTDGALAPRFAEGAPMRIVGLIERYDDRTRDRIPEQWRRFQDRLGEVRDRVDPAAFGVVWGADEGGPGAFDYMTAVMVDEAAALPPGFVERRTPARRYAVFAEEDGITGLGPLLDAIFRDWLPDSGHAIGEDPVCTEVYGEDFDPASLNGRIEIWVPVVPR